MISIIIEAFQNIFLSLYLTLNWIFYQRKVLITINYWFNDIVSSFCEKYFNNILPRYEKMS